MTIGGLQPEAANIISGNSSVGVVVSGTVTVTIRGNSIFDNGALGIKSSGLSDFSQPLPNDPDDADGGGNSQQNYPNLPSVPTNGPSGAPPPLPGRPQP